MTSGIFIEKTAGGYEVVRVDGGTFPMDFFKQRLPAVRFGKEMAAKLGLRLFVEEPIYAEASA